MLLEQKTTDFLEQLSSSAPIPGGGGASAAVGAFASALGLMVTNLTVGKKKYADVEEEILEIREKLEQKKQDLKMPRLLNHWQRLTECQKRQRKNRQRRKKLWRPHLKMRQKHHCVS